MINIDVITNTSHWKKDSVSHSSAKILGIPNPKLPSVLN